MAAVIAIFALKDGDEVDGLLACDRKAIVCRMNGQSSFLVVGLRDGYNSIEARAYADVDRLASRFDRGDIVRVRGKANGHGGALQLRVRDIARSDGGWPTVALRTRDVDELDGFLEHLAEEHAGRYRPLMRSLLSDEPLRERWRDAPCSAGGHHAYVGGLLEHTVAVARLAVELCDVHAWLDHELLVAGALVHDLGHTRSFAWQRQIVATDAGRLVGHLHLGLWLIRGPARRVSLRAEAWLKLAHCVLAHHGPAAVGARRVELAEAAALYRLNAADAAVGGRLRPGGSPG